MIKVLIAGYCVSITNLIQAQSTLPKIEPVNFSQVQIQDNFWKPRINTVNSVTYPVCIEQTEVKTPSAILKR